MKEKKTSYVSRSFLIRGSFLEGLYNLKRKYRVPIYLLVNIAIRNVLVEEKADQVLKMEYLKSEEGTVK